MLAMQRTRLGDVKLTGVRSWLRRGSFAVTMALAVIGFFGYLLPAHSVDGGIWHSNFADGGPLPLVVFGGFCAIAAVLRTRGLGAGMLTGVLAVAAAIASVVPVLLVHLFSHVDQGPGELMFALAAIGLFFGGAVFLIAEPILYWSQRRANERVLPIARVYA